MGGLTSNGSVGGERVNSIWVGIIQGLDGRQGRADWGNEVQDELITHALEQFPEN